MSETKQSKMDNVNEGNLSLAERIAALLVERQGIDDDWDDGIQTWWKKLIVLLSEDLAATIAFINTQCTDQQMYDISEVFEEVAQETQSVEFINCLKDRVKTVENPHYHNRLVKEIEFAEGYLDE